MSERPLNPQDKRQRFIAVCARLGAIETTDAELVAEMARLQERRQQLARERADLEAERDALWPSDARPPAVETPTAEARPVQTSERREPLAASKYVLAFMSKHPDKSFSGREVLEGMQLAPEYLGGVRAALGRLAEEGKIVKVDRGFYKFKQPATFRLPLPTQQ